jgi:serine/threonine protein kinase
LETKESEFIGKEFNGYYINKWISSGGFGQVFIGIKNDIKYALKIPIINEDKNGQQSILDEYSIYCKLKNTPLDLNVKLSQSKSLGCKFLVMKLLGNSLEKIKSKKLFSISQVKKIGISMITLIRELHKIGYIHRDLKPDNFLLHSESLDDNSEIKLSCIDYGMAAKYVNNKGNHILQKKENKFCGTARFASKNAHLGYTQSRKDDLECIGYILIYLLKGELPWQLKKKNIEKKKRHYVIGKYKLKINNEDLCKNLPSQFLTYFNYIDNLDFDEKPMYSSLKNLIQSIPE